ncbi:transposon-transfer assisting family protein [Oscillospiraceae bacterium 50-16]
MNEFTFEERNLLCIYNRAGTRTGLIAALEDMRGYLEPDEDELRELTDSALGKLRRMTDADFETVDLYPDFDPEDPAYGK